MSFRSLDWYCVLEVRGVSRDWVREKTECERGKDLKTVSKALLDVCLCVCVLSSECACACSLMCVCVCVCLWALPDSLVLEIYLYRNRLSCQGTLPSFMIFPQLLLEINGWWGPAPWAKWPNQWCFSQPLTNISRLQFSTALCSVLYMCMCAAHTHASVCMHALHECTYVLDQYDNSRST
jgi:hypothetical protein